MNRREFLQCAAIMVSGLTASQLGIALTEEQRVYLASAPNYNTTDVDYLSEEQRQILAAMCEVIIPKSDSPGAIDAGVPHFIELMAADWFSDEERGIFDAGMADIEQRIPQEYGNRFDLLPPSDQLEILEALEEDASDHPWYEFGNVQRDFISDAPFICQLKELTIWGFFTSERGSKEALRYNPMPMTFDGNIPLGPNDSSWAGGF
ncbi:gluconate 2-dehydrogenase subunit 3 family protein [Halioglobus maricola]|uniref:Gluconate 2-dehydrogenase subunit 3 family protein n=1 Tax=Halioglobus maricola TaxID=2601894 RepID=A0A5P9NK22_9GAMM|nr:gluconate 2-dehydrogenase subunit 3 family protein [Halioglobus maricola]QFU75939.1 gluconate 2-dehydrogenase subunit 3 family protein [Halioglobus maricola]